MVCSVIWIFLYLVVSILSFPNKALAIEDGEICIVSAKQTPLVNSPAGAKMWMVDKGKKYKVFSTAKQKGSEWALVGSDISGASGWLATSALDCKPLEKVEPANVAETKNQVIAARPADQNPASSPPALLTAKDNPVLGDKRVALVVGNGMYQHAPLLTNPPNDAIDVANVLRSFGFDVVEARDVDSHGLRDAIRRFSERMIGTDTALFFYAGHGVQVSGRNYLIPVDAKLDNAGIIDIDAIDLDVVLRAMEVEPRANILVMDACRDNPFIRSLQRSFGSTRSAAVTQGLAQVRTGNGTLVAFATDPGNIALDGVGTRNSPFTAALLNHIKQPGLEIEAMMKRVRQDVIRSTKGRQTPWSNSSLTGDVFISRQ